MSKLKGREGKRKLDNTTLIRRELLLTMYYLYAHSDEKKPASQLAICRDAQQYGIQFNEGKTKNNGIRRERVGEALDYLYEMSHKHPKNFPYPIKKVGVRFYMEKKPPLGDNEAISIASAIKNDRYTNKEESNVLIGLVFNMADKNKRDLYERALNSKELDRKIDMKTSSNLNILNKAMSEKKMVSIVTWIPASTKNGSFSMNFKFATLRCLVYKIKEYNGIPYAYLVPSIRGNVRFYRVSALRFDPKEYLIEDKNEYEDVGKAIGNGEHVPQGYKNVDDYISKIVMPSINAFHDEKPVDITFGITHRVLDSIKSSFETYFGTPLKFREANEEEKKIRFVGIVCSCHMNVYEFKQWLFSEGNSVGELRVLSPESINEDMARRYADLARIYKYRVTNKRLSAPK
jgi:hypothetical protein